MRNGPIHSIALIQVKANHLGAIHYLRDGELHREDGPAIIYSNGGKVWFIDGQYHRTDGPAIISENGNRYWYLNGIQYHSTKDGLPDPQRRFE